LGRRTMAVAGRAGYHRPSLSFQVTHPKHCHLRQKGDQYPRFRHPGIPPTAATVTGSC
jgi:hypothetical protein